MSDENIIYVADFRPAASGGLYHWAMWICTDPDAGSGVSIDVDGFARNWERRISDRHHPAGSARFHAMVEVGGIEPEKVAKITAVVRKLEEKGICDEGVTADLRTMLRNAGQ